MNCNETNVELENYVIFCLKSTLKFLENEGQSLEIITYLLGVSLQAMKEDY